MPRKDHGSQSRAAKPTAGSKGTPVWPPPKTNCHPTCQAFGIPHPMPSTPIWESWHSERGINKGYPSAIAGAIVGGGPLSKAECTPQLPSQLLDTTTTMTLDNSTLHTRVPGLPWCPPLHPDYGSVHPMLGTDLLCRQLQERQHPWQSFLWLMTVHPTSPPWLGSTLQPSAIPSSTSPCNVWVLFWHTLQPSHLEGSGLGKDGQVQDWHRDLPKKAPSNLPQPGLTLGCWLNRPPLNWE
ncbi:hypothetical protein DSO57_1025625 [Entomophthora muscae]|uniref:Uncharacterized protein n=1 Tax=Entomophthora muscae TaxID=34485 RepID=A0ACC2UBE1_9FUNG|nr:hypothetical protein DSO57_1025625 [Entomophthora muscae]